MKPFVPLLLIAGLAACGSPREADRAASGAAPGEASEASVPAAEVPSPHLAPEPPPAPPPAVLAADLIRREWRRADNRAACAPIGITDDGGAPATARAANFAGGWAVAFDTPAMRSAYGVAGTGLLEQDREPAAAQEARLREQWPQFTRLPDLPAPAFAGWGLEGAQPYPESDPDSRGRQSLAYVRVGGQVCTYNVWSKLGRAHLEVLLQSLRPL